MPRYIDYDGSTRYEDDDIPDLESRFTAEVAAALIKQHELLGTCQLCDAGIAHFWKEGS